MAKHGAVDFDASFRNRTIRISGGLQGGFLKYDTAVVIDPAELVKASGGMDRPLLLDSTQPTLPPEPKPFLVSGQERLREVMNNAGLEGASLKEVVQKTSAASTEGALRLYRGLFEECYQGFKETQDVQRAIADGTLDPERLSSYQKLKREEAYNTETIAERHARSRAFGKRVRDARDAMEQKRRE